MLKKYMIQIIIGIVFCLFMIPTVVNAEQFGDYTYSVNNGTITITGYTGTEDVITIPAIIDNKPVTTIGSYSFKDKSLTQVTIPNGVTTIDYAAFENNNLTQVTIPNSVRTISSYAFKNNGMTQVTISNGVTIIGYAAFENNNLTQVTIPNSVTTISSYAFKNNGMTQVTIPNSVITIDYAAFEDNNLTQVTIPNSVTTIGSFAFKNNGMTQVTIPNSVITIDHAAFENNNLTQITIPKSVTTIGAFAFKNNDLTSVRVLGRTTILNGATLFDDNPLDLKLYGYASSTTDSYATNYNKNFIPFKELTSAMVSNVGEYIVTTTSFTPFTPGVVVKYDENTELIKDTNYTVTYEDNDKIGTAKIIVTGLGEYADEVTKEFKISKKTYKITISPFENMTITPNTTINIEYDGSQDYKIIANTGYVIKSILVDGVEKINTLNNDILTISNVIKDTEITIITEKVEPIKDETPKTGFQTNTVHFISIIGIMFLLGIIITNKK